MDDLSDRLSHAIEEFEGVTEALTSDEAVHDLDEATLQLFWQRWSHISSWGGAVWRRLNEDLADAAIPLEDSEAHEVGGEG
jgi:hypothetical protein